MFLKNKYHRKEKYIYDEREMQYKRVEHSSFDKIKTAFNRVMIAVITGAIMFTCYSFIFDTPEEYSLKRENLKLISQYENILMKTKMLDEKFNQIQEKDKKLYRVLYETKPLPKYLSHIGSGGTDKYGALTGYTQSDLMIKTTQLADQLLSEMMVQEQSFEDIQELVLDRKKLLQHIPAIQPVSNKDLKRIASGFGMRRHPILRIMRMHKGMDFTAPYGTEIYATGNGTVTKVVRSRRGYGNRVVIDHGYGYKTLYAHVSKIDVKEGQIVKRGDVIAYVGNSGFSTGPHLHYEVMKEGVHVNPMNYYFIELTPEEYDKVIELSKKEILPYD